LRTSTPRNARPSALTYITDDSGKQEQEAQILELTPSLLAVSVGDVRRDLTEGNVNRIHDVNRSA
jgi:hypothetical protein